MQSEQQAISPRILILVTGVGLVIALLLVELLFRGVMYLSKPVKWTDRPVGYFMPDPSRSLQERTVMGKNPGGLRVSVVGDSFTFGPNMQLADTFPKKLEGFLNLNNDGIPAEVLNRGHSGYSTVNEVEVVKKTLGESPDLVLLQITLNDAEPHILSAKERRELFEAPYLKSRFFRVWSSLGFLLGRLHNNKSRNAYIEYHSKFFFKEETLKAFQGAIHTMHEMCRNKGVPLAVILFPLFDFPIDERYPFTKVHSQIESVMKAQNLPFLDLRRAYQNIPHDRLQVIPGQDSHPNEIAHRIAAERLLAFLVQNKLVPQSNNPRIIYPQRRAHLGRRASQGRIWNLSLRPLQDPEYFQKQKHEKKRKKEERASNLLRNKSISNGSNSKH